MEDKNIDFKELRHVKSENTTIGEFVSDLLTKRKVDAVRIGEIIKSSEKNNKATAVRVASETRCILIHKSFGHRYIFVTVTKLVFVCLKAKPQRYQLQEKTLVICLARNQHLTF